MLKLLFTLGVFLIVALALLALRQHRLELTSESMKIHDQIEARNQTLWGQRVEIARRTNPWTLAAGLQAAGVDTGGAMTQRARPAVRPAAPSNAVVTDLVAPVRGDAPVSGAPGNAGHSNANRPRQ